MSLCYTRPQSRNGREVRCGQNAEREALSLDRLFLGGLFSKNIWSPEVWAVETVHHGPNLGVYSSRKHLYRVAQFQSYLVSRFRFPIMYGMIHFGLRRLNLVLLRQAKEKIKRYLGGEATQWIRARLPFGRRSEMVGRTNCGQSNTQFWLFWSEANIPNIKLLNDIGLVVA